MTDFLRILSLFPALSGILMMILPVSPLAAQAQPLRVAVAGMTHGHVHQILRRGRGSDLENVGFF